jgi:hypothetical protein
MQGAMCFVHSHVIDAAPIFVTPAPSVSSFDRHHLLFPFSFQFVEKRLKLNAGYVRIGGLGFVFLYFAHVIGCGFFFLAWSEYRAGGAGLTQVRPRARRMIPLSQLHFNIL